jgi:RimJ/RimL family protein N-acetyltransferase
VVPAELRTERLLLRQWRADDAEGMAEIYADPQFLEHMPFHDLTETRAQLERFGRGWREHGYSHWAVEEAASGRLIGRAGLLRHEDWPLAEYAVEVGWSLDPDYWGRGYATEAGRASVDCWLERLTEPQLISITTSANVRSRAVMERLGFTQRGETHWHHYDVVWYALDRPTPAV